MTKGRMQEAHEKSARFTHFDNALTDAIDELLAVVPTDITPTDVDAFLDRTSLSRRIKQEILLRSK